jgi:hypothetical protein
MRAQETRDITGEAADVCELVEAIAGQDKRVTVAQLVDVWKAKGLAARRTLVCTSWPFTDGQDHGRDGTSGVFVTMVLSTQLPDGGPTAPSEFTKSDCERIVIRLILLGVLEEEFAHTAYSTNAYVRLSMEQSCSLGGGLLMRL